MACRRRRCPCVPGVCGSMMGACRGVLLSRAVSQECWVRHHADWCSPGFQVLSVYCSPRVSNLSPTSQEGVP